MASLFRAGRGDEAGAGGKLVRGRRSRPSPYSPLRRSTSPAPRQSQSPRWLSGLISGAGKLISSVFGSQSSSPSSSDSSYFSEDETFGASSRELIEQNQKSKSELFTDYMEGSFAIVPRSESKLSIEQLLTQEMFSRDECDRLTKIIQSRVVESPHAEVGQSGKEINLYNRTTGSGILFSGTWHSAEENRKKPETPPYRTNTQNGFSPGSSPLSMCAPDFHATAVTEAKKWFKKTTGSRIAFSETRQSADKKRKQPETPTYRSSTENASFLGSSPPWMRAPDVHATAVREAKKWFKEKKLASSSKSDTDYGPCILNTDMLQYAFAGEVDSPVDMAKTYMRSLPPWRTSPLNIGFRTPPSRMHLYENEICRETINPPVPTSKVLERNGLAVGSRNLVDGNHKDHQKLGDDINDMSNFKPVNSFNGLSEPESFRISSVSGHAPRPHDTAVFGLDKNEVEEPAPLKAQISNSACLHGSFDRVSISEAHGENPLLEMKAMPSDVPKLTIPSKLINSGVGGSLQTRTSSQGQMISDSRSSDGDSQLQPNASTKKISVNDRSGQLNATSDFGANGVDSTQSRNGDQTANISQDSCQAAMDFLAGGGKSITGRSKDGTMMKSIERMLAEPQAKAARRGKKQVAHKSKKAKGRVS